MLIENWYSILAPLVCSIPFSDNLWCAIQSKCIVMGVTVPVMSWEKDGSWNWGFAAQESWGKNYRKEEHVTLLTHLQQEMRMKGGQIPPDSPTYSCLLSHLDDSPSSHSFKTSRRKANSKGTISCLETIAYFASKSWMESFSLVSVFGLALLHWATEGFRIIRRKPLICQP